MWATKFHTHIKQGKIIVLYILIFTFLESLVSKLQTRNHNFDKIPLVMSHFNTMCTKPWRTKCYCYKNATCFGPYYGPTSSIHTHNTHTHTHVYTYVLSMHLYTLKENLNEKTAITCIYTYHKQNTHTKNPNQYEYLKNRHVQLNLKRSAQFMYKNRFKELHKNMKDGK